MHFLSVRLPVCPSARPDGGQILSRQASDCYALESSRPLAFNGGWKWLAVVAELRRRQRSAIILAVVGSWKREEAVGRYCRLNGGIVGSSLLNESLHALSWCVH